MKIFVYSYDNFTKVKLNLYNIKNILIGLMIINIIVY